MADAPKTPPVNAKELDVLDEDDEFEEFEDEGRADGGEGERRAASGGGGGGGREEGAGEGGGRRARPLTDKRARASTEYAPEDLKQDVQQWEDDWDDDDAANDDFAAKLRAELMAMK